MSVARSAARSPWRLSKKLHACSTCWQQPLNANANTNTNANANASPRASALPSTSRPAHSQHARFSTSRPRLQPQKDDEQPASTPAVLDESIVEAEQPPTSLDEPLTPSAEVARVMRAVEAPHRPQDQIKLDIINLAKWRGIPLPDNLDDPNAPVHPRMPRNVQALFLAPLRRQPTHGIPVCNLQLRSYSIRNLEYMADFAMRAAYYLNLPAKGPVPLPRITNRWTVPRSHFIFTKRPENFERVTVRRLVQIQDGHPDVVRRWLQFIRKHTWYGVGYKADVFEFEPLDTAKRLDSNEDSVNEAIESIDWNLFGRRKGLGSEEEIGAALDRLGFADPADASSTTTSTTTTKKGVQKQKE